MIISFDLNSLIFGLLLPFLIFLSFFIALAIGKRFEVYFVSEYVQKVAKMNDELLDENKKLREELRK